MDARTGAQGEKVKKIITIFFVCLIILSYISCEKEKSNPLEGTWKYVRPEINNEFMQIPSEEITNTFYGSKMKTNNSLEIEITYDIDITKDSIITEFNGDKIIWNYEIKEDGLYLTYYGIKTGPFIKQ